MCVCVCRAMLPMVPMDLHVDRLMRPPWGLINLGESGGLKDLDVTYLHAKLQVHQIILTL